MIRIVTILVIIISIACGSYALVLIARLRKVYRLEFLNSFLYYEILHLVFGVYGIYGGIVIREILLKLDLRSAQIESVVVAIPFFGIPFIIASWYLLIKTASDLVNRMVSHRVTITYFVIATLSFLVYGIILRSLPDRDEMEYETLNRIIRIAFYITEIAVKLYIVILVLPAALKSGNLSKRIFLFRFSLYLLAMSVTGAVALHFAYLHPIFGLYFLLIFFGSDIGLIFITRFYLRNNAAEFEESRNPAEDLYQKYGISKREKDIIRQICLGRTNQEIADELFISIQTVKDHTYNIFRKVNVTNRVQLSNIFAGTQ
jgi:DNA-binding CsgD family transcriptional regulator